MSDEASMKAALAPFGWTCTPEFWRRYYTDPWVFNLANAVERQADVIKRLHMARAAGAAVVETPEGENP